VVSFLNIVLIVQYLLAAKIGKFPETSKSFNTYNVKNPRKPLRKILVDTKNKKSPRRSRGKL
jgi:hypothetical protein